MHMWISAAAKIQLRVCMRVFKIITYRAFWYSPPSIRHSNHPTGVIAFIPTNLMEFPIEWCVCVCECACGKCNPRSYNYRWLLIILDRIGGFNLPKVDAILAIQYAADTNSRVNSNCNNIIECDKYAKCNVCRPSHFHCIFLSRFIFYVAVGRSHTHCTNANVQIARCSHRMRECVCVCVRGLPCRRNAVINT